MVKKYFCLFLLCCIIVFPACNNKKEKSTEIIIGCITPLSGEGAPYGRATKNGLDLAADEINKQGGIKGKKLRIVYEDDQLKASTAIQAIQKLININKVPVIIGALTSSATLAIAPIAEKNRVVLFSASATADSIKDAGDYVFRNVPPNKIQGKTAADFAVTFLKAHSAGILQLNTDYGVSLGEAFKTHFISIGGKILIQESYNPGSKDFRAQLDKIKNLHPDVVFFPGNYQESGLILKQAKELGLSVPFIGGDGSYAEELINIAGNAAEGSYYTLMSMGYGTVDNKIAKFDTKFKSKYGVNPDGYAAYSYDALLMIAEAIKLGGYSSNGIKKALYGMKGFRGVTGITEFDAFGEVDKPYGVYEIKNGRFQIVVWKKGGN